MVKESREGVKRILCENSQEYFTQPAYRSSHGVVIELLS